MSFDYLLFFLVAAILCYIFTLVIRKIAFKLKVIDYPTVSRKIHSRPVPKLGGLAIFVAFFAVIFFLVFFSDKLLGNNLLMKHIIGVFIASALIMIGGVLDDKFSLKPYQQIILPIMAVIVVIVSGIGIKMITNPMGGVFYLDHWQWELFSFKGIPYRFTLLADLFTVIWLMGMMYTTKFLDGLDGLVSGITGIGALIIFFLATTTKYFQPDTAYLAIIFSGACAGFLILNWHPAKIFLGEGGSLWTGFMLGILAIISGGKIATALLIMGIPILDVVWVIIRRTFYEKKSPFKTADRKHIHFRLLDVGFSHRQAVGLLYLLAIVFGITTLFLPAKLKLIAILVLAILMIILAFFIVRAYKRKQLKASENTLNQENHG